MTKESSKVKMKEFEGVFNSMQAAARARNVSEEEVNTEIEMYRKSKNKK